MLKEYIDDEEPMQERFEDDSLEVPPFFDGGADDGEFNDSDWKVFLKNIFGRIE